MRHIASILVGFVAAVLVATFFLLLPSTLLALFQQNTRELENLPVQLALWPMVIAGFAGIPTLLFIALSEWRKWRHWAVYAGTGVVISLPGGMLIALELYPERTGIAAMVLLNVTVAGACGALAYWMIAGRNAGNWRGEVSAPRS
ncbi:hypothetical protein GTW25_08445 [Aliihoeflea aestuarii]|nr:hypothetical protein [Aliihoeflea aestuarii]